MTVSPDGQWQWDGIQWVPRAPIAGPAAYTPPAYPTPGYPMPYYGGPPYAPTEYLDGAPVDFGTAVRQAFKHTFVYQGRASRSAYWWFALFSTVILVLTYIAFFAVALTAAASSSEGSSSSEWILLLLIPFGIAWIVLFLVSLSLVIRRLHDTDKSGWWYLISLVPGGSVVLLIFLVFESTPGPNRYQVGPV